MWRDACLVLYGMAGGLIVTWLLLVAIVGTEWLRYQRSCRLPVGTPILKSKTF